MMDAPRLTIFISCQLDYSILLHMGDFEYNIYIYKNFLFKFELRTFFKVRKKNMVRIVYMAFFFID